jgi:hypothetical protein
MKTISTMAAALVASLAIAAPGLAQSAMDADGDGTVTLADVQALYPDVTEETFAAMDSDADGTLSEEEIAAATEAGMLPS